MGVPILSVPTTNSCVSELQEATVSFSVCFPLTQDIDKVFIGWTSPDMVLNGPFWNDLFPDTNGVLNVQTLIPDEACSDKEDGWKVSYDYCPAFIVRLRPLLEHQTMFLSLEKDAVIK